MKPWLQLSVEVGVTSIEAYGCGYVATAVGKFENQRDFCDYKVLWKFLNIMGSLE
jgi:hypothetical protein